MNAQASGQFASSKSRDRTQLAQLNAMILPAKKISCGVFYKSLYSVDNGFCSVDQIRLESKIGRHEIKLEGTKKKLKTNMENEETGDTGFPLFKGNCLNRFFKHV